MATASLVGIPAETRLLSFRHLFTGGWVSMSFGPSGESLIVRSNLNDHDGILNTCKRLRQVPDGAIFAIGAFYRTLIQHITVRDSDLSLNDVLALTGLRRLRIKDVPTKDARDSWGINAALSANAVEAFVVGTLDQKVKELGKKAYLTVEDPGFRRVREIVELPSRTFNISSTLTLYWKPQEGGTGFMRLTYNLDALETFKRTVQCWYHDGSMKIWENGYTETWKANEQWRHYVFVVRVPQERKEALATHPELEKQSSSASPLHTNELGAPCMGGLQSCSLQQFVESSGSQALQRSVAQARCDLQWGIAMGTQQRFAISLA